MKKVSIFLVIFCVVSANADIRITFSAKNGKSTDVLLETEKSKKVDDAIQINNSISNSKPVVRISIRNAVASDVRTLYFSYDLLKTKGFSPNQFGDLFVSGGEAKNVVVHLIGDITTANEVIDFEVIRTIKK